MAAAGPTHYLLLRDFLGPWAQKFGAAGDNWQATVFSDLCGATADRLHAIAGKEPGAIEIVGRRFRCTAKRDEFRQDTLFVYEILPSAAGAALPKDHLSIPAQWRLNRGAGAFPPPGTPITTIPELDGKSSTQRVRAVPTHQLSAAMEAALATMSETQLTTRLAAPTRYPPPQLLQRMRRKCTSELRRVFTLITDDEFEKAVLQEIVHSATPGEILQLHERFGLSFLERVMRERGPKLSSVLAALLDMPAPMDVVHAIVTSWVAAAGPPELRDQRVGAIERWRSIGNELDDRWTSFAAPSLRRLEAMRASSPTAPDATLTSTVVSQAAVATPAPATAPEAPMESPVLGAPAVETPPANDERIEEPTPRDGGVPTLGLRELLLRLRAAVLMNSCSSLLPSSRTLRSHAYDLELYVSMLPAAEAAEKARATLEASISEATRALAQVPSVIDIERAMRDVDEALLQLEANAELAGARAWLSHLHSWQDVADVLSLIGSDGFDDLPYWFFRELAPDESDRAEVILGAIASTRGRSETQEALSWLRSTAGVDAAARLQISGSGPGLGATPFERLKAAYNASRQEKTQRAEIEALCDELGPWTIAEAGALALSEVVASLRSIKEGLDELSARAPALAASCYEDVRSATSLRDAHARLQALESNFNAVPPDLAAEAPSLAFLARLAERITGARRPADQSQEALSLDHCISERKKLRAAQLVARPHDTEPGLFLVDVPLNVRSSRRCSDTFELEIELATMEGRPQAWRDLAIGHQWTVGEDDWMERDEGGFVASLVLRDLPITRKRLDGVPQSRFVVEVAGRSSTTGLSIRKSEFTFEGVRYTFPTIDLPFGDTTSDDQMRQHPIGIQKDFDGVASTVNAGRSSFLVTAPRRFGKTTFLRALAGEAQRNGVVAVGPIAASEADSPGSVFERICAILRKELDVHVPTEWGDALVPDADAFDAARRRARDKEKKAIYFLIDESQALFKGKQGRRIAEQLKPRIELAWGLDSDTMVPIRLGLAGQAHLRRMLAGQLDGLFFVDRDESEIDQEDIEAFIRETTNGIMQSTKSARALLASVSRDLLTLRFLLKELLDLLGREQRTWFVRADVQRVVDAQTEAAVSGATVIARYIKDPLNADDDLTNWRPITAFPVAIAWAVVCSERTKVGRQTQLQRTKEHLERWASEFSPRSTVAVSRIEEELRALVDVRVLDGEWGFRSPLLRGYLGQLGRSGTPLRERVEREALQALLVDSIVLPEPSMLEHVGGGGQASIYMADIEGRRSAVRVVDLSSDIVRDEFVRTCYALRAIEGSRSRAAGFFALPVMRCAGIASDDRNKGVTIYDWIPGVDLAERQGRLDPATVVRLGRPLAEALVVLEQRGVVHRDIRPENVILDTAGGPVLIDFGLAVVLERSRNTKLGPSSYHAPEVQSLTPLWTSKADVYSLGVLLKNLWNEQKENAALQALLRDATLHECDGRLAPTEFARRLGTLAEQMSVDASRDEVRFDFDALISAISPAWARTIVQRHVGAMTASRLGIFALSEVQQLAASCLDDLFEDWARRIGASVIHLTNLRGVSASSVPAVMRPLVHKETFATGMLRHGGAHRRSEARSRANAVRELGNNELGAAIAGTAIRLDAAVAPGLAALITHWLAAGGGAK